MHSSKSLLPSPGHARYRWGVGAALLGTILSLMGCAGGAYETSSAPSAGAPGTATSGEAAPASEGVVPGSSETAPPAALPRKIIYTAEVELGSEDLSKTEQRLLALVKSHRGYVAESDMSGAPGTPRSGRWKIRIPVERFEAFMAEVTRIGELRRTRSDSQDVSAEFYDLEARLKNKRVEEQRLVQHLQRSTARLTDILAVEKELSRVREEIERMQGRVRFLTNQTDLTTVSVSVSEVQDYVPAERAPFGTQMARTFSDSLKTLGDALRTIALVAIWLAPWVLVAAVVLVPVALVLRRFAVPRQPRPAQPPVER